MSRATLFRVCSLLVVLLLAPGCRAARSDNARRTTPPQPSPRTSADILGFAEIQSARVGNAHEALVRFRPEFLERRVQVRSTDAYGGAPVVYLDGVRQGSTDMLRTIPAGAIFEIRFLPPTAANSQFGSFHPGGVIAVRTRP